MGISYAYESHGYDAPVKVPFQYKSLVSAKSHMDAGCMKVPQLRFSGWSKRQATDCRRTTRKREIELGILDIVLDNRVEAHSLVTQRARGSSGKSGPSWPILAARLEERTGVATTTKSKNFLLMSCRMSDA